MNYLAHAYLSFGQPGLLVGNMISDFVKGKKKFDYSPEIQQGIGLHRQIDEFTDQHEITRQAKVFLKPAAGPYAGAFVDVAYDHFLANDSNEFTDQSLKLHARQCYQVLNGHQAILPEKFRLMLPYMQAQNWLYNYKTLAGAENSFRGLARRTLYLFSSAEVYTLFINDYSALQNCYKSYFPFLKSFVQQKIAEMTY